MPALQPPCFRELVRQLLLHAATLQLRPLLSCTDEKAMFFWGVEARGGHLSLSVYLASHLQGH